MLWRNHHHENEVHRYRHTETPKWSCGLACFSDCVCVVFVCVFSCLLEDSGYFYVYWQQRLACSSSRPQWQKDKRFPFADVAVSSETLLAAGWKAAAVSFIFFSWCLCAFAVSDSCSQTSILSVWAFTLSSGTNKKIPVKFSCCTLLWAATPQCGMWRHHDKTCSSRRVYVCEDVCVCMTAAALKKKPDVAAPTGPLSWTRVYLTSDLQVQERLMRRYLRLWHKREEEEEEKEDLDLRVNTSLF